MEGEGGGGRAGGGGGGGIEEGGGGGGGGGKLEGGGGPTAQALPESLFPCGTRASIFVRVCVCVFSSSLGILENLRSISMGTNAVMAPAFCTGVDST